MPKNFSTQKGTVHLMLMVGMIGLVAFLLISNSFSFKDKLFSTLFPKPPSQAEQSKPSSQATHEPKFAKDRVIVQFKKEADEEAKNKTRSKVKVSKKEIIRKADKDKGDLELVDIKSGKAVPDVIASLRGDPSIEFVEPDFEYTHQETSNDPYFLNGSLWGMGSDSINPISQYGSQASKAWASSYIGSSTVYVGVIDTGVQFTHPDLAANIWTNPFDLQDGIDNDGNGYVDDIHGWDFYNKDNSIYDEVDGDNHGTHVSGTIGGVGGNSIGVAGVNWKVTMISAKFLGPFGGSLADAVKAVDYLTDLKIKRGLNIVATSNSWGGGGYSQALYDAIERAKQANILFIAAAGNANNNNDSWPMYPASYSNDNIISVAAIDSGGNKAWFSSYGVTTVDLGAPGVDIYSTVSGSSYAAYNGTSMAAPHVSGAAAVYAAAKPGKTALEIKNAILGTVTPTNSLVGQTVTGGRLNVAEVITGTPRVPPPTPSPQPGLLFTFDNSDNGFTATGFWHSTTKRSSSPTRSFWYGQDSTGNYNNGTINTGYLTSPSILLSSNPSMTFDSWYQTEDEGTWYDKKTVEISVNGGPWQQIHQVAGARWQWYSQKVDLSPYANSTVKIRFFFNTVDNVYNNYEGWYIDNVSISSATIPSPTPTPTPTPPPSPKRVFVTHNFYTGNLGGLTGADQKCQSAATTANLGGTWKAWLSTSTVSASSRLTHHTGSYILLNGTTIAQNWTDLTDGSLQNRPNITEYGQSPPFWTAVWTNTSTSGQIYDSANSCNDWSSASNILRVKHGNSFWFDEGWTLLPNNSLDCSYPNARLYCFEQ